MQKELPHLLLTVQKKKKIHPLAALVYMVSLQCNGALNVLQCCCPAPGMQVESIPQMTQRVIKFVCSLVHEQLTVVKPGCSCQKKSNSPGLYHPCAS